MPTLNFGNVQIVAFENTPGLNIHLFSPDDAIRYFEPKTEREEVLFKLLKEAYRDSETDEETVEELEEKLESTESERDALLVFYNQVTESYFEVSKDTNAYDPEYDNEQKLEAITDYINLKELIA